MPYPHLHNYKDFDSSPFPLLAHPFLLPDIAALIGIGSSGEGDQAVEGRKFIAQGRRC
jgi:hypothetical protein